MSEHRYIIGSGFFHRDKDYGIKHGDRLFVEWYRNKIKFSKPEKFIIIAHGGWHVSPKTMLQCPSQWIHLDGDLGHIWHLHDGTKPFEWTGFTMAMMTLCLLAYQDECDLIFCEQDMLAFGPWPGRMYSDMGDANMAYGKGNMMPVFQSLQLIRHWFLPHFVFRYLRTGSEREDKASGENHQKKIIDEEPHFFRPLSFGYDRDRPFNISDEVFYLQQVQESEKEQLYKAGLLD